MEKKRSKVANFFLSFLPVLALEGIQGIVMIIGLIFAIMIAMVQEGIDILPTLLGDESFLMEQMMNMMVIYAIVGVVIFGLWYSIFRKDKLETSGKYTYPSTPKNHKITLSGKTFSPSLIFGLILLAIALQYVAYYIMAVITAFRPELMDAYTEMMESAGLSNTNISVAMVLAVVIFAPACEELALRGVTLGYASRALPFWAANILQALLFGIMHGNVIQGAYAFVLGLFLGYLYHISGNIKVTILLHIFFNGASTFFGGLFFYGEESPYLFCLILFLAMCLTYVALKICERALAKKTQ